MAKKLGRPPIITAAHKDFVCAKIAAGATVKQVATALKVAPETVYKAVRDDAEFAENYARAREVQLERWEDELLEIADDSTNDWMEREGNSIADQEHISRSKVRIDTRKWLMSHRLPKKYGDRVAHTGPAGNDPVQIEHRVDLSWLSVDEREQLRLELIRNREDK